MKFSSFLFLFFLIYTVSGLSQESESIRLKKKLKHSSGVDKIETLKALSKSYRFTIPTLSEDFAKQAVKEAENQSNILQEVISLRYVGASKEYLAQYDSSIFYFQLSKSIANENKMEYEAAVSEVNLAFVYIHQKNYSRALEIYLLNLEVIEKRNDATYLSQLYNNIGNIYLGLNEVDNALHFLTKSAKIKLKKGDLVPYAITLSNIANVYKQNKEYVEARKLLNKVLEIFVDKKSLYNIALTYIYLSELELSTNNNEAASLNLKLALSYSDKLKIPAFQAKIFKKLSKLYILREDYKRGYEYHKMAVEISDSLLKAKSFEILNEQKALFEIDFLNQKIEKSEQDLAYAKKRNFLLYGLVSLLLILLIGFFVSRLLIDKKNAFIVKQTLKEKNIVAPPKEEDNREELRLIYDQIIQEFEENELYQDQKLTLNGLSAKVNSNSTYVSKAINHFSNKNFKTFLNEFRVKKAVDLLSNEEHANLTLAAISEEAGFSSVSVFNRSFKQTVGVTPSYFLKSVKNR